MSVYDHTLHVEGVDLTAQGNTLLGTTPSNTLFYPLDVQFICTSGSGLEDVVVNLGTNSPDYDNIIRRLTLTGVDEGGKLYYVPEVSAVVDAIPVSTDVYVRVALQSEVGTGDLQVILTGSSIPV